MRDPDYRRPGDIRVPMSGGQVFVPAEIEEKYGSILEALADPEGRALVQAIHDRKAANN